jgi:iron complex outermembrane receptor protein
MAMARGFIRRWAPVLGNILLASPFLQTAVSAQTAPAAPRQAPVASSQPAASVQPSQPGTTAADQPAGRTGGDDLFNLNIEQLSQTPVRRPTAGASGSPTFDIPVSTLSRDIAPQSTGGTVETTVGGSPAAVYVLTEEDIRRSGQRSIPDALRMVPGLDVARIDSNKWAISSRGFNGRFANKLLVLMDGRSVYTPLFSGVFWDERDTMLDDIERIEVIRGPGATLWGANAVNGVINIISKKAQDTQGFLLSGGGGSEERGFGALRYGGKIGDDAYYRVYVNYFNRASGDQPSGLEAADAWQVTRGGFRFDWNASCQDSVVLEGDIYGGNLGDTLTSPTLTFPFKQTFNEKYTISGEYVLGRWTHVFSDTSNMSFQCYYDRTHRDEPALIQEERDTVDLDFQHRFALTCRQEIVWGLGYRLTTDHIIGSPIVTFDPGSRTDNLFSSFVQDDLTVVKDQLHLIVGTKLEHNDYTGFEIQPGVRLLWTPNKQQTIWTSVARAVRTPSRAEANARINTSVFPPNAIFPGSPVTLASFFGNSDFVSEELTAYEAGYRVSPIETLSLDFAGFFNDYQHLRTGEPAIPFLELSPPPPHLVAPFLLGNKLQGETYGVEIAGSWKPADDWKVHASYTLLETNLRRDRTSQDVIPNRDLGKGPHNQFNVRSFWDLTKRLEFDTALYYVDNLPDQNVHSYVRLDTRVGWHPRQNLELVLGLQNLLTARHQEFGPTFIDTLPTPAERSIYGMIRWRF